MRCTGGGAGQQHDGLLPTSLGSPDAARRGCPGHGRGHHSAQPAHDPFQGCPSTSPAQGMYRQACGNALSSRGVALAAFPQPCLLQMHGSSPSIAAYSSCLIGLHYRGCLGCPCRLKELDCKLNFCHKANSETRSMDWGRPQTEG